MASSDLTASIFAALLIAVAASTPTSKADKHSETTMTLYLHDVCSGPGSTAVPIAGLAGKLWTFNQFGTVYVVDDNVTETPDRTAEQIGNLRGIAVTTALDGSNAHVMSSIVFNNGKYSGSTIELQGTSKMFQPVREVAVVAGTGNFRYARGYATFENYYLDIPNAYSVTRCNVTLLQWQKNDGCNEGSPFCRENNNNYVDWT